MPDAHDERFRQHEAIMERLTRMLAAQHVMNEEQREMNRRQEDINQRLTLAIERIDRTLAHVEITQARMETLFTRILRPEDNGRDA